jgi:peptide/nickel transport system ATP-binding protein
MAIHAPAANAATERDGVAEAVATAPGAAAQAAREAAVLEVSGLRVELSADVDVIDGISFRLAAGEILGLVGESGSGKTTLATALLAHARKGATIAAGEVVVAGRPLLALRGEELRRARGALVGYVPQDPATALNPALRLDTLLRETLRAHEPELDAWGQSRRLEETLRDVGLPGDAAFLRRFPHQLSGGQQQRVLLALAFVLRPRLIVLDEPTTALDVATQAHILDTLRRLCKRQGVAAVYVSHDLAVIRDLVDRIVVMYAGRLVEQAGRDRLFAHPAHPYSRGLLAAIPDVAQRRALEPIPGYAPAPAQRGAGCAFAPRCASRSDACLSEAPALRDLVPGHRIACLHPLPAPDARRVASPPAVPAAAERAVLVEVRNLNVAYDRQVLFDMNLDIRQGECLALVGESGSGKTSFARVLGGLGDNAEGDIRYDGEALALHARRRPPLQRRQIQYIFQNPYRALNPRQTVRQSLLVPLQHFFAHSGRFARERIDAVLERVSLPASTADLYPHSLSGGERQRVAIARALLSEPRLLICDEITSALDVSVQASIIALLQVLQRDGLTLLFVTHDLGVVRAIADRIVVLRQGRVEEQGAAAQVLDAPAADYTRALVAHSPSLVRSGDDGHGAR